MTFVKFATLTSSARTVEDFRQEVVEYLDDLIKEETAISRTKPVNRGAASVAVADRINDRADYHVSKLTKIRDAIRDLTIQSGK